MRLALTMAIRCPPSLGWRFPGERSVDEVFVRRDVIDPAKLRSLCVASNVEGARQTLSHLGAIAVTGTLLWLCRGTWWAVPLFAVHGVLLNFLYAGQHELSHWTVSARAG